MDAGRLGVPPADGRPLFHIIDEADWHAAKAAGELAPPSLEREGFVHLSHRHQVMQTANRFYRDADGLIAVEFDPAAVGVVVLEDSYDAGESFPHVYGAIPVSAAAAEHPLLRDSSGDYTFS